jgi:hypothetical protein
MTGAEITQSASKKVAKLQHSEEFLEEVNSSIVRQTPMVTGDFDVSR